MRRSSVALLALILGGCGTQFGSSQSVSATSCAAPETYSAIKKMLFDDVRKIYSGNVKYVNDLDKLFEIKVEGPTLQSINKDTNKADCQGRLTLPVPASMSEQFGRQAALTADIGYTVQPSADGKGLVFTVGGYDEVLQDILGAASSIEGADKPAAVSKSRGLASGKLVGSGEVPIGSSVFAGKSCEELWFRRNQIFAENGYCFKSQRGIRTFGNDNCYTDTPDPPMYQQREVAAIKEQEAKMSCNIQ